MRNIEIEYKWQASEPRSFSRARAVVMRWGEKITSNKLKIKDIYLDHANQDLSAQKIALRVRNTDGKWEATYKTRTQIKNGKAQRRETTKPLPGIKNEAHALRVLGQRKRWGKINLTKLEQKFSLHNNRTIYTFIYDGAELEMALDAVVLCVCGRQVKLKEIEVELKRGRSQALDRFACLFTQQTHLRQAEISKVKTAEMLLKMWKK